MYWYLSFSSPTLKYTMDATKRKKKLIFVFVVLNIKHFADPSSYVDRRGTKTISAR